MPWHSDFKSFTENFFLLLSRGEKYKISDFENEVNKKCNTSVPVHNM